jgi:hypothetical protein
MRLNEILCFSTNVITKLLILRQNKTPFIRIKAHKVQYELEFLTEATVYEQDGPTRLLCLTSLSLITTHANHSP